MLDQLMLSGKMQHTAEPSLLHCINSTWKQQNTIQPQSHVRSVQPGNNRTPYSHKVMSDLFNLETTAQNSLQLPSLVQSTLHANYSTEQLTAPRRLHFITVWWVYHRTAPRLDLEVRTPWDYGSDRPWPGVTASVTADWPRRAWPCCGSPGCPLRAYARHGTWRPGSPCGPGPVHAGCRAPRPMTPAASGCPWTPAQGAAWQWFIATPAA